MSVDPPPAPAAARPTDRTSVDSPPAPAAARPPDRTSVDPPPAAAAARPADRMWLMAASVGGLGYLPWAPGTWGTLAGLGAWYACRGLSLTAFLAVTAAAVALALVVSAQAERLYGAHDVGHIVIDEVAGMLCAAIGLPWDARTVIAAFVLFRLLDALKPPPIGLIDRRVPGAWGVVLDDVAAGLIGCALVHGGRRFLAAGT